MKDWFEVKEEFEADGSLRDIYIFGINVEAWDEFIQKIQSEKYQFKFMHGSSEQVFPDSFSRIKEMQKTNPTILSIWLNNNIQVNCHFFMETEIELDISPKEIKGPAEYRLLTTFMKWLSGTLRKPAILTHEGTQDQVILSVSEYAV